MRSVPNTSEAEQGLITTACGADHSPVRERAPLPRSQINHPAVSQQISATADEQDQPGTDSILSPSLPDQFVSFEAAEADSSHLFEHADGHVALDTDTDVSQAQGLLPTIGLRDIVIPGGLARQMNSSTAQQSSLPRLVKCVSRFLTRDAM
jgi:hypothetical protein